MIAVSSNTSLARHNGTVSKIEVKYTKSIKYDLSLYANDMVYLGIQGVIEKLVQNGEERHRIETVTLFGFAKQCLLFRMLDLACISSSHTISFTHTICTY